VVEIAAKLVHEGSGRIKAAEIFQARMPARAEAASAVPALDAALRDVMTQMVGWVSKRM